MSVVGVFISICVVHKVWLLVQELHDILGTTCCILVLICITCTVYIYLYAVFVILVLILFNIYTNFYLMSSPLYNVMYALYSRTCSRTLNI